MTNFTPSVPELVRLHFEVVADESKGELERLSSLISLQLNLEDFERTLAHTARANGKTLDEIGVAAYLSRQGAQKRYRLAE